MGDEVMYEVDNSVAWLTINRPEARNALSAAVREGLAEGLAPVHRGRRRPGARAHRRR